MKPLRILLLVATLAAVALPQSARAVVECHTDADCPNARCLDPVAAVCNDKLRADVLIKCNFNRQQGHQDCYQSLGEVDGIPFGATCSPDASNQGCKLEERAFAQFCRDFIEGESARFEGRKFCEETTGAVTLPLSRPFNAVPPTLSIPIPGLPFPELSKIELKGGEADRYLLIPWLGQYLAAIYNYLIALAALVATIMIVVGGMQWLLAAGATDKISEAKKRITNAVIGLILALGTYILLYTLNPDLVSFKALKVSSVATEKLEAPEEEDETIAISGGGPNCPNPADVVDIPRAPGLNGGGNKVHRDIIAPLTRAAAVAFARGCTLQINSGWRSLATQTQLWNESLAKTKRLHPDISEEEAVRLTRSATSFPDAECKSPHMTGRAVDVAMFCGGEPYLPVLGCAGQNNAPVARRADLQELMHAQGFVRYCAESWHFELGTDRWASANAAGASCGGNWVCRGTEHTPHY